MALHVAAFLEMLTKAVTTRATTATRAGCVRRGMGQTTPFSGRGSRNAAEDDPQPNILQLNTDGLTENKISVIEQLAYKNKAFIIVLQETHCTTEDKLVIPNFSLAGSILSRNHVLATFVHERMEWLLVDQSPEKSETVWLCVDIAKYCCGRWPDYMDKYVWTGTVARDWSLSHPAGHKPFTRSHCVRMHHVTYRLCLVLNAFFCPPLCGHIYDTASFCKGLFLVLH